VTDQMGFPQEGYDLAHANSRWKVYVYHYLIASLVLAVIAHLAVELMPDVLYWVDEPFFEAGNMSATGRVRALIYLILAYGSVVPIYLVRFDRLLRSSLPPKKGLPDRIFLTLFGSIFLAALAAFPFAFVLMANVTQGRAGLFVASFTESFFGLIISGAFILYSVTFAIWLLLRGIPRLWTS
jgi:hypothetical protein